MPFLINFEALKKHGDGKKVKRKKREDLLPISTWISWETSLKESRTSRLMHFHCSVVNLNKHGWTLQKTVCQLSICIPVFVN